MESDVGLAWYTPPGGQPIYLVVDRGRVTACTPHAQMWALGRTASQIRQRQRVERATIVWIPLSARPRPSTRPPPRPRRSGAGNGPAATTAGT